LVHSFAGRKWTLAMRKWEASPPYDHWVPEHTAHPSATYWLKYPVKKKRCGAQ
jgi:hypothetical protein